MKLDWVTIRVKDLEKSVKFYTEELGMEIAARFGSPDHQIVMLGEKDQPKIELIYEPGRIYENPGAGVSIGLEIDGLDQLVGALKEKGHPVAGPMAPNPRVRFFFVPDPDGYSIQLVEQK